MAQPNIPDYKIIKQIGDGGMGKVYLAEHTLIGNKVAVKSLKEEIVNNPQLRARFQREAKTLSKLNHHGIVRLNNYIEKENEIYLIMEYSEGTTIHTYIKEKSGPIVEGRLIKLFLQILDAFEYVHNMGIIHRDIKPTNIIVDDNLKTKIIDFGIGKTLEETKIYTKVETQMGTIPYMSPEQVMGSKNIDHRSDIYSLGVTLYEMATAKCPYNLNEISEFVAYSQIANDPLPRASETFPDAKIFEEIIDKATAKNKEDRFQTCAEFKKALLNINTPTGPPIPGPGGPGNNNLKLIITIGAIILLIILSTILIKQSNNENNVELSLAEKANDTIADTIKKDTIADTIKNDTIVDKIENDNTIEEEEETPKKKVVDTPQVTISPDSVVKQFLLHINNNECSSAFKLQKIKRFINNGEAWFKSKNGYGSTDKITINAIKLISINNSKASVNAKYISFDKQNSNFELEQEFYLEKSKSSNKWIITDLKNISAIKF